MPLAMDIRHATRSSYCGWLDQTHGTHGSRWRYQTTKETKETKEKTPETLFCKTMKVIVGRLEGRRESRLSREFQRARRIDEMKTHARLLVSAQTDDALQVR
jgi:hypothetical protein